MTASSFLIFNFLTVKKCIICFVCPQAGHIIPTVMNDPTRSVVETLRSTGFAKRLWIGDQLSKKLRTIFNILDIPLSIQRHPFIYCHQYRQEESIPWEYQRQEMSANAGDCLFVGQRFPPRIGQLMSLSPVSSCWHTQTHHSFIVGSVNVTQKSMRLFLIRHFCQNLIICIQI